MDASVSDAFKGRCLDPVPILSPMTADQAPARCRSQHECTKDHICTYPDPREQLMRIGIHSPDWQEAMANNSLRIVLWDGPRSEVYEQVIVSYHASQHWWLPSSLPLWSNLFFQCAPILLTSFPDLTCYTRYFSTISLSLYFFNLLPLPFLDGAQFVKVLLRTHLAHRHRQDSSNTFDFDAVEAAEITAPRLFRPSDARLRRDDIEWVERWTKIVRLTTAVLVAIAFGLAVLLWSMNL
jgi:S2P endopeptidase